MESILQKEVSPMGEEPFPNPAASSLDAAKKSRAVAIILQ